MFLTFHFDSSDSVKKSVQDERPFTFLEQTAPFTVKDQENLGLREFGRQYYLASIQ